MIEKRVCVIGLGGGGCKILDRIAGAVRNGGAMVAMNTDSRSLAGSCATTKFQIGLGRTRGLGTGGDAMVGRQVAREEYPKIKSLFAGVDMAFLVVGLGGGTGTGAAPVVLEAAREEGVVTLCFATLPFEFEGRQRRDVAEQGIGALRDVADALIVVPNDRLAETVGSGSVPETFVKVDDVLGAGLCAIWKLITQPGYIGLDFATLRNVAQHSGGLSTLGYGTAVGKDRAQRAVANLMEGPLLEQGQVLARSQALLVSIVGGPDLAVQEVGEVMKAITTRASNDCRVFMGTVIDESARNKITITIVASEQWTLPEPSGGETAVAQTEILDAVQDEAPEKKKPARQKQTDLRLDFSGKGRFGNVEPTILEGEDWDIPTFIRRRITIEK